MRNFEKLWRLVLKKIISEFKYFYCAMIKKVKRILSDIPGYIFRTLRKIHINLSLIWGTGITRFLCFLKGVKLGKHSRFYGRPRIHRNPHCRISIGDYNTFRSDLTNNIGYNNKCILLAREENSIIETGNNSSFNGVAICAVERITIGNNVMIGYNALLTDSDGHPIDPEKRVKHTAKGLAKPIIIKDNVWIGANSTILKGVQIGENSVIGANSYITTNIPPNVVAAGNPCKVVMPLAMIIEERE